MKNKQNNKFLKINEYIDQELYTITLILIKDIVSVEYSDGEIEIETGDRCFAYQVNNIENAREFIDKIVDCLNNDDNIIVKEIHHHLYSTTFTTHEAPPTSYQETETNGDYWVDDSGNKFSKIKYTKAEADKLAKTLIDCKDCIDCTDCEDCVACVSCEYCLGQRAIVDHCGVWH